MSLRFGASAEMLGKTLLLRLLGPARPVQARKADVGCAHMSGVGLCGLMFLQAADVGSVSRTDKTCSARITQAMFSIGRFTYVRTF